jgi:hypothetical protein
LATAKRLTARKWPAVMTVASLALGMAYMLWWGPLVHHEPVWTTGGDLWGVFRGAHYVGWGFLGGIYTPTNSIITFPGMSVLLAPVAMLSGRLQLTESVWPFMLERPGAALLLQPVELLLASTVLFAVDSLAERLGVGQRRRISLCMVVATIAWPVSAIWGHAEDVLAMTFAIYAMVAMLDRQWSRCGWLFGFGIVMQPLVALMLPLFIGATPRGKRVLLALRSSAVSVALVAVAFAGAASDTYRALVKQPTPPSVNHATPWVALAPKVTSVVVLPTHSVSVSLTQGHYLVTGGAASAESIVLVAGGPGRSIDVVIALIFGVYVWRRPQQWARLLWLAAVVLTSRCFFEAVMTPYYIAPPLLLALALAARQSGKRFWAATILALEITVFAYYHLSPWAWWLPILAGLVAILVLGYPTDLASESGSPVESACESTSVDQGLQLPEPARLSELAL